MEDLYDTQNVKIAVLLCERFDGICLPHSIGYADTFVRLFKSASEKANLGVEVFDVKNGHLPAYPQRSTKYVITGSLANAYESLPWIKKLGEFTLNAASMGCKFVGICFGHQFLAQTFGGTVGANPKGWGVGKRISFLKDPYLRKYFPQGSYVLEYSHHDIVKEIPPNAKILSGSDFCAAESLKIGDFAITFQGHPEFDVPFAEALYGHFKSIYTTAQKLRRLSNANLETDNLTVARVILDF